MHLLKPILGTYSDLLAQANTGEIIHLGTFPNDSWAVRSIDGLIVYRRGDQFFLVTNEGSQVRLASKDCYEWGVLGNNRTIVEDSNQEFWSLMYGEWQSVGVHPNDGWRAGKSGFVIKREDSLYLIEDGVTAQGACILSGAYWDIGPDDVFISQEGCALYFIGPRRRERFWVLPNNSVYWSLTPLGMFVEIEKKLWWYPNLTINEYLTVAPIGARENWKVGPYGVVIENEDEASLRLYVIKK